MNFAVMIDCLVLLTADVESRSGTPWMAASTGVLTSWLTTSGDAPG